MFSINPLTNTLKVRCNSCGRIQAEYTAAYYKTAAGKASTKRANASESHRIAHKKHRQTPKHKERQLKRNAQPDNKLRRKLWQMTKSLRMSQEVKAKTPIASCLELRSQLESSFEPWMNWQNQGLYRKEMPYKKAWQLGHKICCAAYDVNDPTDLARCFSTCNIFAQDAKENNETRASIPSNEDLFEIRQVWPLSWEDKLPTQAWRNTFYSLHYGKDRAGSSSMAYTSEAEDLAAESADEDSAEESSAEEDSDSEEEDLASGSAAASSAAAEMDQEAEDSARAAAAKAAGATAPAADAKAEAFRAAWARAAED